MTNLQEAKLAREAEICYATHRARHRLRLLASRPRFGHGGHDHPEPDAERQDGQQRHRRRRRAPAGRADLRRAPARSPPPSSRGRTSCPRRRSELAPIVGSTRSVGEVRWSDLMTMKIIVTGSIAFDYLMSFPASSPSTCCRSTCTRVSLSFLVDSMDKRRGGCAPNIAYTLALLGERPRLMATAGQDFAEYRQWLEAAGVDTSLVLEVPGSSRRRSSAAPTRRTTRSRPSTPAPWPTPSELSFRTAGPTATSPSSSPNDPGRCCSTRRSAARWASVTSSTRGSSARAWTAPSSATASSARSSSMCNDYELELIRQKTGMGEAGDSARGRRLIVTRGEHGCSMLTPDDRIDVPAVTPHRIVDPTGVGDAFRGGFMKGLARRRQSRDLRAARQRGRHLRARASGGQSHAYTRKEFESRYEAHFGPLELN